MNMILLLIIVLILLVLRVLSTLVKMLLSLLLNGIGTVFLKSSSKVTPVSLVTVVIPCLMRLVGDATLSLD